MKESALNDICCPICSGCLQLEATETVGDDVITGILRCAGCDLVYPIQRKIPDLIPKAQTEAYKLREMGDWVNLWEKKGMYEHPTLHHSISLPYIGGMWTDVARMFDMSMELMDLKGDEVILEVGAGQGWASRYFAEKGCRVYAVDIVADESYGLGAAWRIMEHADTYFEPMLADGERLPFPSNSFDIVYFCGALHHFVDPEIVLRQAHRLLKPGGRLVAAGEPSISWFTSEAAVQATLEEVDEEIIERRPRVWEYRQTVRKAGFGDIQIDTYETYCASPEQIRGWISQIRRNLVGAVRTRFKPFVWLTYTLLGIMPARAAGRLALEINGGNLLIQGTK